MSEAQWYVVKQGEQCGIFLAADLTAKQNLGELNPDSERWGPFASQAEAIARRVGLIRAGKCKPV